MSAHSTGSGPESAGCPQHRFAVSVQRNVSTVWRTLSGVSAVTRGRLKCKGHFLFPFHCAARPFVRFPHLPVKAGEQPIFFFFFFLLPFHNPRHRRATLLFCRAISRILLTSDQHYLVICNGGNVFCQETVRRNPGASEQETEWEDEEPDSPLSPLLPSDICSLFLFSLAVKADLNIRLCLCTVQHRGIIRAAVSPNGSFLLISWIIRGKSRRGIIIRLWQWVHDIPAPQNAAKCFFRLLLCSR